MKVNDTILFCANDTASPVEATVTRVTKTQLRLVTPDGKERGPYRYSENAGVFGSLSKFDRSFAAVVGNRDLVEADAAHQREIEAKKRATREARLRAHDERIAAQMVETKAAVGDLLSRVQYTTTLEDGTTVMVLDMPTLRHGRSIVTVRVSKARYQDGFEAHGTSTYVNAGSFSSRSGCHGATQTDAVWACLRSIYHD